MECSRGAIVVRAGDERDLRGSFTAAHHLATGESVLRIDVAGPLGGRITAQLRARAQDWTLEVAAMGLGAAFVKAMLSHNAGQLVTDEQGGPRLAPAAQRLLPSSRHA